MQTGFQGNSYLQNNALVKWARNFSSEKTPDLWRIINREIYGVAIRVGIFWYIKEGELESTSLNSKG